MVRSPRTWTVDRRLDVIGLALIVALGAWIGIFAGAGEGRPAPVLWVLAGTVLAYEVARRVEQRFGLVLQGVALAVTGSILVSWPGILQAGGPPAGYANANATLCSLGCIAAVGAAASSDGAGARRAWSGLAVALLVATVLSGSVAGVASLLLALGLLAMSRAARWPGFAIVGGLCAVSLALGGTAAIALGADPAGLGERTEVRGELWSAAATLAHDAPLRGVGPGEFATANEVSSDADLRWAHHGYLQSAAEYGIPGLTLIFAALGWSWVRLWCAARAHPVGAAVGGGALVVFGVHGTVDYVWHVPIVVLITAVMVGGALGRDS